MRVIGPNLLNEFELAFDAGVDAQEMDAAWRPCSHPFSTVCHPILVRIAYWKFLFGSTARRLI